MGKKVIANTWTRKHLTGLPRCKNLWSFPVSHAIMRKKTGRLIQKRTNPAPFYIPYLTKLHLMSTNREVLTTIITEIKVTWFITLRTFGINWSTQLFPALFPYSSNILDSLDCFDDDNKSSLFLDKSELTCNRILRTNASYKQPIDANWCHSYYKPWIIQELWSI